jgi:deoxyribodipyrimidine photolyase-related protein
MKTISLIFPHQLFEHNPCIKKSRKVFLIEEYLFFKQYAFHKQKLVFHRASMKFYQEHLKKQRFDVEYIDAYDSLSDIREFIRWLSAQQYREIHYVDTIDNWLEKRLTETANKSGVTLKKYQSPMFLNSMDEISEYFKDQKSFYQTKFYIHQRKKFQILTDANNKPFGGKWSFDSENRRKYPGDKTPPEVQFPNRNTFIGEAEKYVKTNFDKNPGHFTSEIVYPVTFNDSRNWLHQFLQKRLDEFGHYEDAIVGQEKIINHSLLSPLLNSGLITPEEVIKTTLVYLSNHDIPLNSSEGFIRQIMGWREFIRAVYLLKGSEERTMNFWGFSRNIPSSFWSASTGIEPLDLVIKKVLETGYCHHIERLMVLGNFMLLCEFHPDEVYRWFMEMFIDAYDWVMVPNVYGMSQFADGGIMSTKPYISSSHYLMKMGDFKKGAWQMTWDALFWRFMHVYRDFFLQNPRLAMLIRTFDKMAAQKKEHLLANADEFLTNLK